MGSQGLKKQPPDLDGLNEAQKKAVYSEDKAILLLAGPGSGKTYTIVKRLLCLIHDRGVPPEKILVITFTRDAARSMEKRFRDTSGEDLPIVFGTFHSVFYNIVRISRGISGNGIVSEEIKKKIISDLMIKITGETDRDEVSLFVMHFISAMSEYKNTLDKEKAISLIGDKYADRFFDVLRAYESLRKKKRILDFDDMVYDCMNIFAEDERTRNDWNRRFDHILVDEFQDINPSQYETLKLLTGTRSNIFAVGDDDQSIYGFRGSRPECMKRFENEYSATVMELDINYRSFPCIVNAAGRVIQKNKNRYEKHIKSYLEENVGTVPAKEQGEVQIKKFESEEDEYEFAEKMIRERGSSSMALLFRTNVSMQSFASRLMRSDIEFHMKEKVSCIYDHFIAVDILSYLRIVFECADMNDHLRIRNRPNRFLGREAFYGKGNPLVNAKRYYALNSDAPFRKERLQAVSELEKDISFMRKLRISGMIRYICEKTGYKRYINKQAGNDSGKQREYADIIRFLIGESEAFEDVTEWDAYIEKYREELPKKHERVENRYDDLVWLMTAHASKGLEFDKVIIPGCIEGEYPHGKMPDQDTLEEERRVFYVAMTRAKSNLLITYTESEDGKIRKSRFINDM